MNFSKKVFKEKLKESTTKRNSFDNLFQLTDNIISTYWGLVRMKRYILLLIAAMFLVACGDKGIKDGEFTFTEEDFKDEYENRKNEIMPDTILVDDSVALIDFASKGEVIDFLKTANGLIDDDEINKIINTFKNKGTEDIVETESDKLIITIRNGSTNYTSKVMVKQ